MNLAERTLPHNLEAERSILGAILLHNEALPVALTARLQPDSFFRDAHRRIFDHMLRLHADSVPIDLVTLQGSLGNEGEIAEVGGPAYITALVDGMPRSSNIEAYAAIVIETARLRATILAASTLMAAAYAGEASADLLDRGVADLLALAPQAQSEPVSVGTAVKDYVLSLDGQTESATVLATGFADLDAMLAGGLRRRDLTIIAARPSVGKSALAFQMALHLAAAGYPAVVFSIEMSKEALAARAVAGTARIDLSRLAGRFLGDRDWGKLAQTVGELADVPLLIDDRSTTMLEIIAWCEQLKRRPGGLACAVIDYLQMVHAPARTREQEVAMLSRTAKRLAKDADIAVIVVSQLSRAPEGRTDKRPHLSDLRESGALEQDADVALLLFRPDMYDKDPTDNLGVAEVIVAKQRNGPTGVVKLAYIRELTRFENLAAQ